MFWLLIRMWSLFVWLYGPLAVWESWKAARESGAPVRKSRDESWPGSDSDQAATEVKYAS